MSLKSEFKAALSSYRFRNCVYPSVVVLGQSQRCELAYMLRAANQGVYITDKQIEQSKIEGVRVVFSNSISKLEFTEPKKIGKLDGN